MTEASTVSVGIFAFTNDEAEFSTGVTAYNRDLLQRLCLRFPDIEFVIYLAPENARSFRDIRFENCRKVVLPVRRRDAPPGLRMFSRGWRLLSLLIHPLLASYKPFTDFEELRGHSVYLYTVFGAFQLFPRFVEKRLGAPCISAIHDVRVLRRGNSPDGYLRRLYLRGQVRIFRDIARHSRLLLVPSASTQRLVEERLGAVKCARSFCVPSPTECEEDIGTGCRLTVPGLEPGRFFFFPATIIETKNHSVLIRAFAHVMRRFPDVRLVLCGSNWDSSLAGHLRRLAADLGVDFSLVHLGFVEESVKRAMYRRCCALVVPSQDESFNLCIWEAYSLDCPVIVSDDPELAEQVGVAALTTAVADHEDLARAMGRLLDEPDLRQRLIQRGRERLREVSEDSLLSGWETELLDAATARSGVAGSVG